MTANPRQSTVCAILDLPVKGDQNSNREPTEQSARRVAAFVAESQDNHEAAVALVDAGGGLWRVTIYFRTPPDLKALRALIRAAAGPAAAKALRFERVAAKDWISDSLAALAPVAAGRFVVHGAHDRARIAGNRIGIEIEAALAFGTGHHGTTRGCLLALDRICKMPHTRRHGQRVLDLGTGSGVLAIAVARALHRRVLATDVDLAAVRSARTNTRCNRVGTMVQVVRADGVTARSVREQAPFDLVFANILLGPLQRFAAPLRLLTAPGGRIVLSGIVPTQTNAVIAAYRPLRLERRIELDGWTTLVLARRARRRSDVARPRSAAQS
jgi:ribosomal protein L11 methyltransferase